MTKYLAGVLTVIAGGVLVIAYSLVAPHALGTAVRTDGDQYVDNLVQYPSPTQRGRSVWVRDDSGNRAMLVSAREADVTWTEPAVSYASERRVASRTVPVRTTVLDDDSIEAARPHRARAIGRVHRDWKRTAMVVGGATATGAGIGGAFGGGKGALVGAAIAGGVSTLFQAAQH